MPEFWGQMAGGGVYKDSFIACGHFLMVISTWAQNIPAPPHPLLLVFYPSSFLLGPLSLSIIDTFLMGALG